MSDLEKKIIEDRIKKAKTQGVKVILLPSLVRSICPIKDFKALLALVWLIIKENLISFTHIPPRPAYLDELRLKLHSSQI